MRSDLTSGILAQLTAQASFYGYLLELTTTSGSVFRYTSIDVDFSWNGFVWTAADLTVSQLTWDGTVRRTGRLIIGDADLSLWALALNLVIADATVRLWGVYNAASGEAAPIFSGRAGKTSRNGLTVEIEIDNSSATVTSPRLRVQNVVSHSFLLPAGFVMNIGGQSWSLNRPTSAAG